MPGMTAPVSPDVRARTLRNFCRYLGQQGVRYTVHDTHQSLRIPGDLWLHDESAPELPADMTVEGSLHVYPVSHLPEGLVVMQDLHLDGTDLVRVPPSLMVGGNLYLVCSGLTTLPEGFRVGGHLELMHSALQSLPEGLDVGGHLNIQNTAIQRLPTSLQVGGPISPPTTLEDIRNFMDTVRDPVVVLAREGT